MDGCDCTTNNNEITETIWDVKVSTSDMSGAGTNAKVHMTLYGTEGHSEQLDLENESDTFETGQVDLFTVQTPHIGIPTKMRIGHDNAGAAAGWHLHNVSLLASLICIDSVFLSF